MNREVLGDFSLPAAVLGSEPDTCWLYTGGADPAASIFWSIT